MNIGVELFREKKNTIREGTLVSTNCPRTIHRYFIQLIMLCLQSNPQPSNNPIDILGLLEILIGNLYYIILILIYNSL